MRTDDRSSQYSPEEHVCEEEVFGRVQQAMAQLRDRGETITQSSVCKMVQMSLARLASYPRAWELLEAEVVVARSAEKSRRRSEMLDQALHGIEQLNASELPITQIALGDILGIPLHVLRNHSEILSIMSRYKKHHPLQEAEVRARVEAAIEQLEKEGKFVTQGAIVEKVGVSLYLLKKLPRVRRVLSEVAVRSRRRGPGKGKPSEPVYKHLQDAPNQAIIS